MYAAERGKLGGQSGTGIYYQAIPAVAADGKNIMKLIPVQMVNGRFFQTDLMTPGSVPQKSVARNFAPAPVQVVKKATLSPSAPQQSCREQVTSANALSTPVELDHGYSLNKPSLQQRPVNSAAKVFTTAASATNCDELVRRPYRFPVTVKSPALPKGHHILIPPNAQVQTVPASELPSEIKKQICIPSGSSSSGSGLQRVLLVSPVTTVIQGATPPNDSAVDSFKLVSETSGKASCAPQSKGSKPHLKLIPKVSLRPNSPIKWVIEEDDSSVGPVKNPLCSSSVTSEILEAMTTRETADWHRDIIEKTNSVSSKILQVLAERETASKHCNVEKTVSQPTQSKIGKGQENSLVMCNGKVFFLAKKHSLPFKMGQNDPITSAAQSYEVNKTMLPSSQQSVEPVAAQTQPETRIVIPDESDDIIDLCDDDDSTQQDASVDEDNVIFVSYIPPKAGSASQTHSMLKLRVAPENETGQMDTGSSNCLTVENPLDNGTSNDDGDEGPALTGQPDRGTIVSEVSDVAGVCGSAAMSMHEVSSVTSPQSSSTLQVESVNADVGAESPAGPDMSDSGSEMCSQKQEDTHKLESCPNPATHGTSSLAPNLCQTADHQLRKEFGITAYVCVSLQRIDENSAGSGLAQPLHNTCTGHTNSLQHPDVSCRKRERAYSGFISVKKVKLLTESEFSASPDPPAPHTDVTSKDTCHSGHSSHCGSSCDGEGSPVFGYVEPIDEDFPGKHENNIPKSQTCEELNANTRRLGRTRKRTMCPCCTAGSRLDEADGLAWATEQMRKKEGRTNAPGKD